MREERGRGTPTRPEWRDRERERQTHSTRLLAYSVQDSTYALDIQAGSVCVCSICVGQYPHFMHNNCIF